MRRGRSLVFGIVLALLAAACGVLVAAWMVEKTRADCWRDLAEEGVSSAAPCRP